MSALLFDEKVAGLNARAIGLAKATEFDNAAEVFAEAYERLDGLEPSIDRFVQAARVQCDEGFTSVRKGVHHRKNNDYDTLARQHFHDGESTILESLDWTSLLLEDEFMHEDEFWVPTPHQRRGIAGHHMASTTVLVRAIHAHNPAQGYMRWGFRGHAKPEVVDSLPLGRGGAYDHRHESDNGYYRVDTAFTGAMIERANGRFLHVFPWLGRGMVDLAWTAKHDPENFKPAALHAGRLTLVAATRIGALKNAEKPGHI